MERMERRKQRKKKRLRKRVYIILAILLLIIGAGGYMAFQTYIAASESYDDLGRDKSDLREEAVSISDDPVSILLMGVEDYSSGGQHGRSDTLIVATFNPDNKQLKLLSIPRDTLVPIAGKGFEDKITHSFAYGGKKMTIETVEQFLDIPIDYYATVNFDAFKNIVNIVDGVTVDVPFDFQQKTINEKPNKMLQFHEGEMKLNGTEALAYARMRKEDPRGDIGRNERQQQVVKAIIDKITSVGTVTKIDDLASEVGNNVETNMSVGEGLGFYKKYSDFSVSNIDKLTLETYAQRINGGSYQIADEQSLMDVKQALQTHLELSNSTSATSETESNAETNDTAY